MHINIHRTRFLDLSETRISDDEWRLINQTTGGCIALVRKRPDGMWVAEMNPRIADESFSFVTFIADNPKTALDEVIMENIAVVKDVLQQLLNISESFDCSDEDYTASDVECEIVAQSFAA